MTERRRREPKPEPLREKLVRRALGLLIAFGFAALWLLLMDASEKLWRWLGWG